MAVPFLTLIAKEAIYQLVQKLIGANLVNRNYENLVATKGQSVTILTPETVTTQNAGGAFASADANPGTTTLSLDNWVETVPIKVSSKVSSMSEIDLSQLYSDPIANALVTTVEKDLFAIFDTFTATVGAAGTAPTGIGPLGTDLKAKFDGMIVVPDSDRNVILDPAAEGEYHKTFGLYNAAGDKGTSEQTTGLMGQKFGMNFYGSPNVNAAIAGYAFHRNAVVMASRPVQPSTVALQGTQVAVDYKGVGLTVEHWHSFENSADYLRAQVLFGFKKLNENAFKILK
jgi:hypothetical protein